MSNPFSRGNGSDSLSGFGDLGLGYAGPSGEVRGRGRGRGLIDEERGEDEATTDSEAERSRKIEPSKRGRLREEQLQPVFTRPKDVLSKCGTTGTPTQLITNHFKLRLKPGLQFRQYRVDFIPDVDDIRIRKSLLFQQSNTLGAYIYDGGNLVYLCNDLSDTEFKGKSREGTEYSITFRVTDNIVTFSTGMGIMVLNTMLRRAMDALGLQLVQRNLYDPKAPIVFDQLKLELWPGYITSIRQFEQDVLICCEISHKVMRQDTVFDILKRLAQSGGDYKGDFEKEIINTVVLTGYNNKTYSIVGVDWNKSPLSTFGGRDGQTTFIQYYKQRYDTDIRERNQPLLITRLTARDVRGGRLDPALLVPELCRTTGLTDEMRNNFNTMKQLGEYTRMNPECRYKRLLDFSRRLRENPESKQIMLTFGVKIEPDPVTLSARIIKPEEILFGNNSKAIPDQRTADWTPAIRTNTMFANETCNKWVLIYPRKAANETSVFLKILMEVSHNLNFTVAKPKEFELPDDRLNAYTDKLTDICKLDPKMIMIVFMGSAQSNGTKYAAVKKITCVTNSIPTQCILNKTMQPKKGNMAGVKSIATKVALQMNCKLGGAPWMINMPMNGVMVCGFDVSHNTATRSSMSYGAFVASMDLKASNKFFSSVAPHTSGEEMAPQMRIHMQKALYAFRDEHGTLPSRIIFYRDGVGDGQIDMIVKTELDELKKLFGTTYQGQQEEFKFAFVIVNKRINTRFFEKVRGKLENPVPGTIVDSVVTLPERYDFFLVSQSVRQGTVSPTSYNIIYDTFGLNVDRMQMLAYKMCHLYYNWCGTTRVPCVVQYAHKLSILVGEHIGQVPNIGLDRKLFYL